METEKMLMGQKQLQRWPMMKMVEVGRITLEDAGERIGVSRNEAKRTGWASWEMHQRVSEFQARNAES